MFLINSKMSVRKLCIVGSLLLHCNIGVLFIVFDAFNSRFAVDNKQNVRYVDNSMVIEVLRLKIYRQFPIFARLC